MQKSEPLISIIIPVYKSEKYLERCVGSLINQTYKNLEIILIYNPEANNKCPEICNNLKNKFSNIELLHQEDLGPSAARNEGIKVSRGRYLVFVDSDDFVSNYIIEELKNDLEKNKVMLSMCGFERYTGHHNQSKKYNKNHHVKKITDVQAFNLLLENQGLCAPWAKMYDASLFDDISFPVTRNEDMFIMPQLFKKAKQLTWNSEGHYYYSQEGPSLVRSPHTLESAKKYYEASKYWRDFAFENYPELTEKANLHFYRNVVDLCKDLRNDINNDLFDLLQKYKQEVKDNFFYLFVSPGFTIKDKIKTMLCLMH